MPDERKINLLDALEGVRIGKTRSRSRQEFLKLAHGDRQQEKEHGKSASFQELAIGSVYKVGNKWLGIPRESKLRHPAAVIKEVEAKVGLSKGTGADRVRPEYSGHYVVVHPDGTNGLMKATAFDPRLRWVDYSHIFAGDYLGSLSVADVDRILEAVDRLSPSISA